MYAGDAIGNVEILITLWVWVESSAFFRLLPSEQVMKRMITKIKVATATQIVPATILFWSFDRLKTISLICLQVNRWKHLPRRTTYINCIFVKTIIYSIKVKCRWQDKWNNKYAKLRNYDLIVCKFLLYFSYYLLLLMFSLYFPFIYVVLLNQLLAYENKQQLHNS